jgi:hypothetical protein
MIIKPKQGQSIFDVAIINTGDPLKAFEMAFKNDLNVTDNILGQELEYALDDIDPDNAVLGVYNIKKYEPATMPVLDGIFDRSFDLTFE